MCFFKSKKRKEKEKQEKIARLEEKAKLDIAKAEKKARIEAELAKVNQEETEKKVQQPKEEVQEKEVVKEELKETKTAKVATSTPAKKAAPKKKEEGTDKEKEIVKYHVSQNKDSRSEFYKQWRVRKSGSQKTIKYFPTQEEAINYAKILAKNNDSVIVIHKLDGTIRKQKY